MERDEGGKATGGDDWRETAKGPAGAGKWSPYADPASRRSALTEQVKREGWGLASSGLRARERAYRSSGNPSLAKVASEDEGWLERLRENRRALKERAASRRKQAAADA